MILTIAMVVYNEEKRLPLIRGNMEIFKNHGERVKFLIVDNASTDATLEHLTSWQKEFPFEILRRAENNMGGARADAVLAASTPWLAFLDADCVVDEAWMRLALKTTEDFPAEAAAFGGPWIPAGANEKLFSTLFKTFYGNFNMPQIKDDGTAKLVRHIPTACVVYRRQFLLEAGNFDSLRARVGEDLDMSYRLLSRGKSLMLLPSLRFSHHMPETLEGWFRKIFSYGNARIRMAILHRDLLAPNYLLPILFFVFMAVNVAFIASLKGVPVLLYLLTAALISAVTEPTAKAVDVFFYMIATHAAYSGGMAWGACALTYEAALKRKPLVPMHYKPESVEEI